MNTLHVSICISCGHETKNWLGKCSVCHCKTAHYISEVDPFALQRKAAEVRAQITGNGGAPVSNASALVGLTLFVAVVTFVAASFNLVNLPWQPKAASGIQTALKTDDPVVASSKSANKSGLHKTRRLSKRRHRK